MRATRYRNRLEVRSGALWEGRCDASRGQAATYRLACARYIELNLVGARIVAPARKYSWPTSRQLMGVTGSWATWTRNMSI